MAEQRLDVKVTEQGTAVVTSQIDKLTAQLTGIEKAQEKETAATEKATAATERQASALENLLKKTEGKFAIFDRIAGVMGKVNLALDLVNKAYQFGKMVVEDYILKMQKLDPTLQGVNARLATQIDLIKKLASASGSIAGAAGVNEAQLTPGERVESRRLEAERIRLEAEADRLGTTVDEGTARIARQSAAVGGGGIIDPNGDYARAVDDLERVGFELDAVRIKREKLIADIKTREVGGDAPKGGGGKGAKDTGGADSTTALGQIQGATEGISGAAEQTQLLAESTSLAISQIDTLAESYANAATMAGDLAAATGKAAIAAAAASIFAGKSIAEGVSVALEAKAQEAAVESAWWLFKAAAFSITAPQYVGPALAASGLAAAVAVAAGVGSAVLGGGGGGGGGSSAGGGAPSNADFGPRRERDTGGGQTIVNVYNDGLTLSTENDIGRAVAGSLRAVARSPGSQSGAIQINTGGARRR